MTETALAFGGNMIFMLACGHNAVMARGAHTAYIAVIKAAVRF
jgi:hypothetical protein